MEPLACGIEISAQTLLVCVARPGHSPTHQTFPNTRTGHRQICRLLRRLGRPVHICLEATGTYGLDLATTLHQVRDLEVMVANPRAVRRFAQALMRRGKTDRLDVEVLCEYAARMPFEPWTPPACETLELRAVTRRIQALTELRTAEKNRLHAYRQTRQTPTVVCQSVERTITRLTSEIDELAAWAKQHIRQHASLNQRYRLLLTIKGIGPISALKLLGELAALPEDLDPRQWVASAGLDPRVCESGTSVNKPRRISRLGNPHLRRPLYMPALVAVRWDEHFKAFYQELLARGKKPLQALVAVMRKLLHAIWGVWKHKQDFDGARLFPQITTPNKLAA